jgi:hypothetical protein
VPYAEPHTGTVDDQQWASIHSSPPWEDTDHPVIVRHTYGQGLTIYSAADIETTEQEANARLLVALLMELLPGAPRYQDDAHPAVWMNVYLQEERQAMLIVFLNYQQQLPAIPLPPFAFSVRPPAGKQFLRLLCVPDETPLPFTVDDDGTLHAESPTLAVFHMLKLTYQ